MVETRRNPRYRVWMVGSIEFSRGPIDCTVRDLSISGAALDVESQTVIPAKFTLAVPSGGLRLPCHVVWRRPYRIGVAFD